jgi:hypothetical protein
MPPPAAKHSLTPAQKDTLRRWIASGAAYSEHWAFPALHFPQPPRRLRHRSPKSRRALPFPAR